MKVRLSSLLGRLCLIRGSRQEVEIFLQPAIWRGHWHRMKLISSSPHKPTFFTRRLSTSSGLPGGRRRRDLEHIETNMQGKNRFGGILRFVGLRFGNIIGSVQSNVGRIWVVQIFSVFYAAPYLQTRLEQVRQACIITTSPVVQKDSAKKCSGGLFDSHFGRALEEGYKSK